MVNVKGAVVNGGGGAGGVGGAAGGITKGGIAKGLIAGALTGLVLDAIVEAQKSISAATSSQATEIHNNFNAQLPTASTSALATQLAAIDTGIQQITSNPLLVLVQGDALDQLRQMRADVAKQIAAINEDHRDKPLPKGAAKADDIRETNRINKQTTSKIDAAKVETSRKIDDTTSAIVTSQTAIVSAIQALASAFHITISASDITKAQKQQQATRPPTVLNRGGAPIAT